jgi:hypothetical protein
VWISLVRSTTRTNMSLSLLGGSGLKGELSPSILVLVSSVSTNAVKALCLVDQIPWHWPLRWLLSESGMYLWMSVTVSLGHVA